MIDYEKYHKDGYGVFRVEDILSADEIIEFNKAADLACTTPFTDDTAEYVLSVAGFHDDPVWPYKVPVSEVAWRLQKIKDESLHATQRWYFTNDSVGHSKTTIENLFNKFLRKLYPEFDSTYRNLWHQDSITLYKDGDYTEFHRDGQNQGRICALLIYLTPEEEYNNGGGELVIASNEQSNTVIEKVKPVRGNLAILDFTNNNPFHGVEPVTNGFNRYCFLSFVLNLDKAPGYLIPEGYQILK